MTALAVIGRSNSPLFVRTFGSDEAGELALHFSLHSALDEVEARVAGTGQRAGPRDSYIGLLYPTEEQACYGYLTNTQVKFVLVVAGSDARDARDGDVKAFFKQLHGLYADAVRSPLHTPDGAIASPRFSAAVEQLVATAGW